METADAIGKAAIWLFLAGWVFVFGMATGIYLYHRELQRKGRLK